jgi:putative Ca2+/H+ antiporter (TMEM165/GDT1 family)
MTALFTTFLLVGIAEMADKTQLLTLSLTCKYPPRKVLIGVGVAIALLNLIAVAIGGLAGQMLPVKPIKIVAGLMFLAFGIWTLVAREEADADTCDVEPRTGFHRSPVFAVTGAFFIAEIGDKTQLATLSLAARFESLVLVWLGACLGMLAANALAIGGGSILSDRVPETTLKKMSGVLFIGFGMWTLMDALV